MKVGDLVRYVSPGNRWNNAHSAWGVVLKLATDFHGRKDGGVIVYWNSTRTQALVTHMNLEVISKQ